MKNEESKISPSVFLSLLFALCSLLFALYSLLPVHLVFPLFSCYIYPVEPEIVFVPSAFRHGVTREDILHACRTRIRAGLLEGNGNKYGFIGFNRAGNPIEVFYNPIGENKIKVFHAMGCRNGILDQLEY